MPWRDFAWCFALQLGRISAGCRDIFARIHQCRPSDCSEALPQVPTHQPVSVLLGQQRGHPVDHQLSHSRLPQVLNAAYKPLLEGVRVISAQCSDQLTHQEQSNTCFLGHGSRDCHECSPLCSSNKNPALRRGECEQH